MRFVLVDVFAEAPYAGNQLAVVLGGEHLGSGAMQAVARELYFSETAFILSGGSGADPSAAPVVPFPGGPTAPAAGAFDRAVKSPSPESGESEPHPRAFDSHDKSALPPCPESAVFDVRIFTPLEEVPFAGHPVLGTAHVLRTEVAPGLNPPVTLNLKAGRIPVRFGAAGEPDVYWMDQLEPVFGRSVPAEQAAAVVGLAPDDLDPRFPVQEVSTGLPHVLVPLKNLDALRRAQSVRGRYLDFVRDRQAKAVLVFCAETHEPGNDVSTRMFADAYGITEDPATGSGNGCLAAYLVRHRVFGKSSLSVRSEQGYEIGRPSLLRLEAEERNGRIRVAVGGRVVTVARGEFV
ncbi:MAG: PhzF family phenazine biosynthesis protein [bacterium]|nr:PhzF family phenazine biosynthesis protein [bacterium]